MGLFSRMGDIINSNLNAMIDKAEDPEKIARLIIQEMEDTLVDVRTDAARNIAERKELVRRAEGYDTKADQWAAKAELALSKDREDLARGALQAKQQSEQVADVVRGEIETLDAAVAKADSDLETLQTKLDEAKAKHRALAMRANVAGNQIRMRGQIRDDRVGDALARYERMERRVEGMEAQVEAYDLGSGQSLESQFAALEANDAVDAELERLRARISKTAKKVATK